MSSMKKINNLYKERNELNFVISVIDRDIKSIYEEYMNKLR